jgi:hypothetical protein
MYVTDENWLILVALVIKNIRQEVTPYGHVLKHYQHDILLILCGMINIGVRDESVNSHFLSKPTIK